MATQVELEAEGNPHQDIPSNSDEETWNGCDVGEQFPSDHPNHPPFRPPQYTEQDQLALADAEWLIDFAYESASIRQNTNTKIFLRNSDREVEYAANFLDDGREIINLPTGTAVIHNPAWGAIRVKVRSRLEWV